MKTDVLFIHRQLSFAVSIKQALERTGNYSVHPFTSVEAALEYLGGHTQDVALVDFMMPVYSGEEIVERVRQAQPQLTVVATPTQTEDEFARLNLQGMLAANFTALEFIPVIERALEGRRTGELPPSGQRAGLLDRVQTGGPQGSERRPPTSVIGYRSLESILNEGAASRPAEDAPTLVQPAAPRADDLSFMDDVLHPPAPLAPEPEQRVQTERLPDMDKFDSDEVPAAPPQPAKLTTDPLDGMTRPLGDDEAELFPVSSLDTPTQIEPPTQTERLPGMDQFNPEAYPPSQAEPARIHTDPLDGMTRPLGDDEAGELPLPPVQQASGHTDTLAGMTRPLPEEALEFEDLFPEELAETPPAAAPAPWSEGDHGTRPLPEMTFEDEQFPPAGLDLKSLPAALRARDPMGTRPLEEEDVADLFGAPGARAPFSFAPSAQAGDEEEPEAPVIDYFAELDLNAHVATPESALAPEAAPNEEDVVAGLVALFAGEDEAPVAEPDVFDFDELVPGSHEDEDAFAGVLGEIAAGEPAERAPNAFDDLVASMKAQEQRPPLPARQQVVEPVLTEDMSSLLDQIEQAQSAPQEAEEAGFDLGPVDLSAVLFEGDEEEMSDTPPAPMIPPRLATAELPPPALASAEELAALFGAPPEEDEQDWSSGIVFEEAPAGPDSEPELEAMVTLEPAAEPEPDLEALFAPEAESADADFEAMFGVLTPSPEPEPDFEAMFGARMPSLEPEPEPDFDAMFGSPAAAPFSDAWDAAPLEIDETPGFEETGTVSDLMTGVGEVTGGRSGMLTHLDTGDLPRKKPARAETETAAAPLPAIDDSVTALLAEIEQQLMAGPPPAPQGIVRDVPDDSGDTPAKRILTTTEAELTDSSFSVSSLIRNIEAQVPPNRVKVQPLPSWLRTPPPAPAPLPPLAPTPPAPPSLPEVEPPAATAVHAPPPEPVIESEIAFEEEPPFDWEGAAFDDTTLMGEAARLEQVEATGEEETGWLDFIQPEGELPQDVWAEVGESAEMAGLPATEYAAGAEADAGAAPEFEPETEAEPEAEPAALRAEHIDDPHIAQLALSLTDVSLELTADAVLLTRGADIAAFAGRMSRDELIELRQVIDDDWAATSGDARIRFLRLPDSGKDVMLYSRHTVEDLTLSLVFDGAMPLRDIRQQGKRLTDALAAIPEAEPEPEPEPEVPLELVLSDADAAGDLPELARSPHAFVWLLRDPNTMLARPVAQAILNGLHTQLHEHGWRVREMRASDDHIYLLADSPDELPPPTAVRELQRRSAQIANVQNPALSADHLWADAYLVVTPGRTLEADEIQQFIQFERMQ